jgi:glycosyltransferase involved in cell wall biosynthesis
VQLARLGGFELVRLRPVAYLPWHFLGVGSVLNAVLPAVPGLRWLSFVTVAVLRPAAGAADERPSLTVVIPARNERGNIEAALRRLPDFGAPTEVVFVEGHSTDGTWEEIQRIAGLWDRGGRVRVKALQQTGKGKADAVRLGFSHASGELLTILDADLTMPPESLTRFYDAYRQGLGDFVNGTRLVYPMEGEAMRFLNHLGNVFFAKLLSYVLDVPLGDSLCGTKLMARHDYERFVRWRRDFGDFDPFGDFELLFPAAVLATGIIDIPVYYRARTYGTTNIRRFRDGSVLFRMALTGLVRIKFGNLR